MHNMYNAYITYSAYNMKQYVDVLVYVCEHLFARAFVWVAAAQQALQLFSRAGLLQLCAHAVQLDQPSSPDFRQAAWSHRAGRHANQTFVAKLHCPVTVFYGVQPHLEFHWQHLRVRQDDVFGEVRRQI